MKRIRIFLLNGFLLSISSLLMQIIGMCFNIFISNRIGTESIGIFGLIMSVYLFFITIATSGINLATCRIISEQIALGLDSGIKKAMKKCLFYSLFMSSISFVLLFSLSPLISVNFLKDKVSFVSVQILSFSLPFIALSSCIKGYFSAFRKVKRTIMVQLIEQVGRIFCICILIKFFTPINIENACICLSLGSTISEALSFFNFILLFFIDKRKLNVNTYTDTNYTKQILRIALPISFTSYIRSGLSSLKQLLIPISLEKSGLSYKDSISNYGIINGMVIPLLNFPCLFISSFSLLLVSEFSYMNAKRQVNKINFSLEKILKFCFIFSFLVMGIFWCFSKELNTFIYPNTQLFNYIKLLCPLIILMYIDNIVDNILKGLDKQISVMGINILDLASSIFLIYFLLPFKGISGYIIVLFASEFLNGFLSLLVLIKHTNLKIDFINWIVKPLLSIIFINVCFSYLNFQITNILNLIFSIICFGLLYFISILLLKGIVKEDIKF